MAFHTMRDIKGFTVLELIIVIGIIGILTAIALPNYRKLKVKAREAEATSTLSAMFMAEKAYVHMAGGATDNLLRMGYTPDGTILFDCGFGVDIPNLEFKGPNDPIPLYQLGANFANTAQNYCGSQWAPHCVKSNATGELPGIPGSTIAIGWAKGGDYFWFSCIGNVGEGAPNRSYWIIEANKNLQHIQSPW